MECPFVKSNQLYDGILNIPRDDGSYEAPENPKCLPGHPYYQLGETERLTAFLEREFCAPDLEAMAPRLWMMSTQSSGNINPLHKQKVKGREIVITEDPRLHLVWGRDRILMKPIPIYLLSYDFWTKFLLDDSSILLDLEKRDSIRRSALGYLRTYYYLVRHESDFFIGQELRLIPKDVNWPGFCDFISDFEKIPDSDVSSRYSYGELRLARLNFYIQIFLWRSYFERVRGYEAYFSRFHGVLIFAFAALTVVFSAMQVELLVEQTTGDQWVEFWRASRYFSVLGLVCVAVLIFWFIARFLYMFLDEWQFAIRMRWKLRKERRKNKNDNVEYT